MPEITLTVFDPNITLNSPAGSCLLKMLQAARSRYALQLFAVTCDLAAAPGVAVHCLPVPARPILVQNLLFALLAAVGYWSRRPARHIAIATQGAYPFAPICYSHNPHKLFLSRYRHLIGGGPVTRLARILNYRWIAFLEGIAFRRARFIVVPSQGLAAELSESHGPSVAAKLRVIANPVDCVGFAPPVTPKGGPFTFAFCALGNFDWKGLRLILDAMARGMPARLCVIGGTEAEAAPFRSYAATLNLSEQVEFAGLQRDIRPYLWKSHAFVFPSVHESFGLVCFQAAAAGLPLIATDLYALSELLLPGVSGWRVERTVESIRQAMHAAVADPVATARMGGEAQRLAAKYDEPTFQQRWLHLLAECNPV